MEGEGVLLLPLQYYRRKACLCMKKVGLARRSRDSPSELQHLRNFCSLVADFILPRFFPPSQAMLSGRDTPPTEALGLQQHLLQARSRIAELQEALKLKPPPPSKVATASRLFSCSSSTTPKLPLEAPATAAAVEHQETSTDSASLELHLNRQRDTLRSLGISTVEDRLLPQDQCLHSVGRCQNHSEDMTEQSSDNSVAIGKDAVLDFRPYNQHSALNDQARELFFGHEGYIEGLRTPTTIRIPSMQRDFKLASDQMKRRCRHWRKARQRDKKKQAVESVAGFDAAVRSCCDLDGNSEESHMDEMSRYDTFEGREEERFRMPLPKEAAEAPSSVSFRNYFGAGQAQQVKLGVRSGREEQASTENLSSDQSSKDSLAGEQFLRKPGKSSTMEAEEVFGESRNGAQNWIFGEKAKILGRYLGCNEQDIENASINSSNRKGLATLNRSLQDKDQNGRQNLSFVPHNEAVTGMGRRKKANGKDEKTRRSSQISEEQGGEDEYRLSILSSADYSNWQQTLSPSPWRSSQRTFSNPVFDYESALGGKTLEESGTSPLQPNNTGNGKVHKDSPERRKVFGLNQAACGSDEQEENELGGLSMERATADSSSFQPGGTISRTKLSKKKQSIKYYCASDVRNPPEVAQITGKLSRHQFSVRTVESDGRKHFTVPSTSQAQILGCGSSDNSPDQQGVYEDTRLDSAMLGNCCSSSMQSAEKAEMLEMRKQMLSLQELVNGLEASVKRLSGEQQQGQGWQEQAICIEKDLYDLKLETEAELLGLKKSLQVEINSTLSRLTEELHKIQKHVKTNGDERNQHNECEGKMSSLRKELDSWLSWAHSELRKGIEESTTKLFDDFRNSYMADFKKLKRFQRENLERFQSREEVGGLTEKQLEELVGVRIEKGMLNLVESLAGEKDKAFAVLKEELTTLRSKVEIMSMDRGMDGEVCDHVELLSRLTEELKQCTDKECLSFRTELGSCKKQLAAIENDGLQMKRLLEDYTRKEDAEVEDLKQAVGTLSMEVANVNNEVGTLRRLEESLKAERVMLRKLVEKLEEEEVDRKNQLEWFSQAKEELGKIRCSHKDWELRAKSAIMDHMESFSQLYTENLEDVKHEIHTIKLDCKEKLEGVEKRIEEVKGGGSARDFSVEDLESRVGALEKDRECRRILEHGKMTMEHILGSVAKDQELASAAATNASASAKKAEELMAEVVKSMSAEMASVINKSTQMQKNLISERDRVMGLISEAKGLTIQLGKEKDMASLACLEAKRSSQELHHYAKEELQKIKSARSSVEREKESVAKLTAEVEKDASFGKGLLDEMANAKRETIKLAEEVVLELKGTKRRSVDLAQEAVAEMVNTRKKSSELAKEVVAEMVNSKRKSVDLAQEVLSELTNAKRKCVKIHEAAAAEITLLTGKAKDMLKEIVECRRKSIQLATSDATPSQNASTITLSLDNKAPFTDWKYSELAGANASHIPKDVSREKASDRLRVLQLNDALLVEKIVDEVHKAHNQKPEKASARGIASMMPSECSSSTKQGRESPLSVEELYYSIKKTEDSLAHLETIMKDMINGKEIPSSIVGGKQECGSAIQLDQMKTDINHLNRKFETLESTLQTLFGEGPQAEVQPLQVQTGVGEMILDFGKKLWKVESMQLDLARNIQDVQVSVKDLEKSAAVWMPEYETAAKVLKNVDSRLAILENCIIVGKDRPGNREIPGGGQNHEEQFQSSYKELASSSQEIGMQTSPEKESISHNICLRKRGLTKSSETRFIRLENRIEHVASATYTNLRILDAKVEHITVGVQSALEGAAMAESKCSALGAELVKVFRMLANVNNRRSSPLRRPLKIGETAECISIARHQKPEPTARSKQKDCPLRKQTRSFAASVSVKRESFIPECKLKSKRAASTPRCM